MRIPCRLPSLKLRILSPIPFWRSARIIPVSSVTGAGLAELRAEMLRIARVESLRGRDAVLSAAGGPLICDAGVRHGRHRHGLRRHVRPEDEVQVYPGEGCCAYAAFRFTGDLLRRPARDNARR